MNELNSDIKITCIYCRDNEVTELNKNREN
jgi:hypothetical protein